MPDSSLQYKYEDQLEDFGEYEHARTFGDVHVAELGYCLDSFARQNELVSKPHRPYRIRRNI